MFLLGLNSLSFVLDSLPVIAIDFKTEERYLRSVAIRDDLFNS
jgi:hypothetical protein